VQHSYATAGRDAKIDWKVLSQQRARQRGLTTRQYVQYDLEADRQVATALAELKIGGMLVGSGLAQEAGDRCHEAA